MTEYILLEADINLNKWNAAVDQMIAHARRLKNLLKFEVTAEVSDSELKNLESRLTGLDTRFDIKPNLADDDFSGLKRRLQELDTTVKINTEFDIGDLRKTLTTLGKLDTTADVKLNVADTEVDTLKRRIEDLEAQVKVGVEGDREALNKLEGIEDKLGVLQTLAVIELALDTEQFVSAIEALPVIDVLVDIDNAVQTVKGRVERDIPSLANTIDTLWTNAWGNSREEIGDVITRLASLRDETGKFLIAEGDLMDAAEGVFQTMAISGEDQSMVIRAAAALVRNEYVGSFREAFDFISKGMRGGLNSNEDFLDSLEEYPARLTNASLSVQGLYNIIDQGAAAGARNTDNVVDAFAELFDLTKEETSRMREFGEETDRTRALVEAGLIDKAGLFTQGKITGDEYGAAVVDALVAYAGDTETQDRLARAIFGPTFIEMAGLQNILAIDLDRDVAYEGSAKEGADIINDTLSTAATEFSRTLEMAVVEALDNSLGLTAMLERGKQAAQDFAQGIREGEGIAGALEIALALPGLERSLNLFQSAVGNIAIALLEAVASLGELLGGDVSGIRATIAGAAELQLGFDIQLADTPDAITNAMITAVERGVAEEKVENVISQTIQDMLDEGSVEEAKALVRRIGETTAKVRPEWLRENLSPIGISVMDFLGEEAAAEDPRRLQRYIRGQMNTLFVTAEEEALAMRDVRLLSLLPTIDTSGYEEQITSFADEQAFAFVESQRESIKGYADSLLGSLATQRAEAPPGSYIGLLNFDPRFMAQGLLGDLHDELNLAIAEGKPEEVSNLALALGFDEATVDRLVQSATRRMEVLREDMTTTSTTATDMGQDTSQSFRTVEEASRLFNKAGENFAALADPVMSRTPVMLSQLGDLVGILNEFDTVGTSIISKTDQLGLPAEEPTPKAAGGTFTGTALVGERGPELITSNERLAVLNNQTTDNIFRALSGAGSSVTNNRNSSVTVINNFNVASMAQAMGAGGHIADQVRGFA